jgi:hypothetical protein
MRPDIRPGTAFPDYELPDHTGRRRRLSEIQGDDPMIIVGPRGLIGQGAGAARGPRGAVAGYEARVGYCRMVTITTTDPQRALNY